MTTLYQNAGSGDFHDVTSGTSTGKPRYSAGNGYDLVTGLGSPEANLVIPALVGSSATTTPPVAPDSLALVAPASTTAGSAFSVTVVAENAPGAIDVDYAGTVRFNSSDVQAGLPATYTFNAADNGSHTFNVILKTAGSQSVTATDAASGRSSNASGIAVSPAAATRFLLSGLASPANVGATETFTVTAEDAYGNVATTYTGTVRFNSSDVQAGLPATYTFTAADHGSHTFNLSFGTAGSQSVTVTDAASGVNVSQSGVTVSPAAPLNLAANAVSTSQIKLTWTGSAGATGYTIDRSANGGSSWTTVTVTAAGATTYQDGGLTAGTTYSYRVQADGGNGSAYSNTASATTTGTAPVPSTTTDSLWSSTSVPNENAYADGAYEVGMKFSTSVAGTVTGIQFYKQTWMSGYTHVGHLWASNGTLLASVTFTGETGSGWQEASFSNPVSLTPGATYEISFSTGGGYFGVTTNSFGSSGVTNGPLHALANSSSTGGNGVYGTMGRFPTVNGNGMNFWVDVLFTPSSSPSFSRQTSSTTSSSSSTATPWNVPAAATTATTTSHSSTPAATPQTSTSSTSSSRTVPQTQGSSWGRRYGSWSY